MINVTNSGQILSTIQYRQNIFHLCILSRLHTRIATSYNIDTQCSDFGDQGGSCSFWMTPVLCWVFLDGRMTENLLMLDLTILMSPLFQIDEENTNNHIKETSVAEPSPTKPKKGLVSWFHQLKEGTLHVGDDQRNMRNLFPKGYVHFSVTDMVELKWVIEDLNGVSYRKSTLISGFQDLGHGSKQL